MISDIKIYLNDMPSSSDNKTLSLKDVTEIAPTVISSVVSQIEVPPESAPIVWINPIIAPSPLVPFVPATKIDTSQPQFSKYENQRRELEYIWVVCSNNSRNPD